MISNFLIFFLYNKTKHIRHKTKLSGNYTYILYLLQLHIKNKIDDQSNFRFVQLKLTAGQN